jgi:3-hydroxyisobutyrate dehydrogenase-like beta-hydroxyacid dehydrogenase
MSAGKAAWIGLGNMGYPMAGHLGKAGWDLTVFNRSRAKADAWVQEHGGRAAATPAEAANGADFVGICVGNDDDLRAVVLGPQGALAGTKKGAVLCDHTTASAQVAREIDAAAKKAGVAFLDAPISGGQEGAKKGLLTIMVGGDAKAFSKAEPAMKAYGRAVTLMGPAGSGQLTKMVNQICCVGAIQALAEAMNFAARAGLDGAKVVDTISKGAAQSWQMENRGKTMLEGKFDFGFAVDWMRKDLGIVLEEARRNGATVPATALIADFLSRLQARGEGRLDNTALIRLLTRP